MRKTESWRETEKKIDSKTVKENERKYVSEREINRQADGQRKDERPTDRRTGMFKIRTSITLNTDSTDIALKTTTLKQPPTHPQIASHFDL